VKLNAIRLLKAPQDGVIKDLSTHTAGAVVQPGTILASLVPLDERLKAEVWVSNEDIGFVRPGQTVKLKFAPYPFQKYGMGQGHCCPTYANRRGSGAWGEGGSGGGLCSN